MRLANNHNCNVPGCSCGTIPLRPADVQGHLQHSDRRITVWLGNALSMTRYWLWRARGRRWPR